MTSKGPKRVLSRPVAQSVLRDLSHDAVLVIPGIMGSTLCEAATGRVLWGLDPRLLAAAWCCRNGFRPLRLSRDEREGSTGRVRATGLLSVPAWAPFLQGFEPYGDLLAAIRDVTVHRTAVAGFPYDWRLSTKVNGRLLAEAARRHLGAWRARLAHDPTYVGRRPPRLVLVAHSMGGLVARAALDHAPDLVPDTRAVITLGTPFMGAVKAVAMLNGHRGDRLPALPRRRLQELAATFPGVHDLLPDYRCVDTGSQARRLSAGDVAAIGGDRELADRAQRFQRDLRSRARPLPGHRAVVGIAQPTMQALRIEAGIVRPQYVSFVRDETGRLARTDDGTPQRRDRAGDGTVYRDAAAPANAAPHYLALHHGPLARNPQVLRHVQAVITELDEPLGPPQGIGEIGLDVPDTVTIGVPWLVRLSGTDTPAGVTCTLHDAATDRRRATLRLGRRDGQIVAQGRLAAPGLYRVRVDFGREAPITQLLLGTAPDGHDD